MVPKKKNKEEQSDQAFKEMLWMTEREVQINSGPGPKIQRETKVSKILIQFMVYILSPQKLIFKYKR